MSKLTSPALTELEAKIRRLKDEVRVAEQVANQERLRLVAEIYHVKRGSIVRATSGPHAGKEFRVAGVEAKTYIGEPWLTVNPKKKNGEFGIAEYTLYGDWEVLES